MYKKLPFVHFFCMKGSYFKQCLLVCFAALIPASSLLTSKTIIRTATETRAVKPPGHIKVIRNK